MSPASRVVEHTVRARLIAEPPATRSLTAALRYDSADPFAVRLVFPPHIALDGGEVCWAFSRELLEEGLCHPSGDGDVHVWPWQVHRTVVELHTPEGAAVVRFGSTDLRRFLDTTYALVPRGEEQRGIDLDAGLAELLREV
ncbi:MULTISPECIES: SsgA family sporulation/cell division regulator [Streptomyces]|uniref:SsgA family sporulation/cell division regulator n=1 Tax=Streptomyces TaxID=1883 RepID=UPI0002DF7384|nr:MULTISPECIES: SsgA family sporulation/cell division regulator [Streptomyces]